MLAVVIALSAIVALIAVNEVIALARSPFGVVRAGACEDLLFDLEAPPAALVEAVREEAQHRDPEAPHASASVAAGSPRSPLSDAAWAGGLAGAAGFADWWHVDDSVLGALAQWTHADIHNRLDLDTAIGAQDYKIDTHGFYIKLRGHVGEQDVYSQLQHWAGDRLYIPGTSNFPDADGALDGHMFNVKVGDSVAAIREHLRDHPDIPVIVNADMTGLPSDAAHVDLSHAFDPNILADHSIIVADGLSLSDIHDSMADALGPAMDGYTTQRTVLATSVSPCSGQQSVSSAQVFASTSWRHTTATQEEWSGTSSPTSPMWALASWWAAPRQAY